MLFVNLPLRIYYDAIAFSGKYRTSILDKKNYSQNKIFIKLFLENSKRFRSFQGSHLIHMKEELTFNWPILLVKCKASPSNYERNSHQSIPNQFSNNQWPVIGRQCSSSCCDKFNLSQSHSFVVGFRDLNWN